MDGRIQTMNKRVLISNYTVDDVIGGSEMMAPNYCRVLKLKHLSATKFGITDPESWHMSELLDSKLDQMDFDFCLYYSTNCSARKNKHEKTAIALCNENFMVEAESMKEVNDDFYRRRVFTDWVNQQLSIKYADRIMVVSEYEKNNFAKFGFETSVLESCIDLELFKPMSKEEARYKLGLSQDDKIALFIGRKHPRKGWDIIQKLMERSPDWKFVNITDGLLSNEDINMCYNSADVFIGPSRYESFGLVYAQALATNLPVIASRVGIFGTWQPKEYGIFPETVAYEAFKDAIDSFSDLTFAKSRELAEKKYSFERFEKDALRLCNDNN